MQNFMNFAIGLAMAAGSSFLALDDHPLVKTILGASSEFLGDSTQGWIEKLINSFKTRKENKKILELLNSIENSPEAKSVSGIMEQIWRELEQTEASEVPKSGKIKKHKDTSDKTRIQLMMQLSMDVLFDVDFEAYLEENSKTFRGIKDTNNDIAELILRLSQLSVDLYAKEMFYKSSDDFKFTARVIVACLENYMTDFKDEIKTIILENRGDITDSRIPEWFEEELHNTILPYIANQNGGEINYQEVAAARYIPKYIKNECPECGYSGEHIYTDEKNNTTYCLACGRSYSILKYCEPELWAEINQKINNISVDMDNLNDSVRDQLRDNYNGLKGILQEGMVQVVTKEYLEKCFNKQNVDISKMGEMIQENFHDLQESYFNQIDKQYKAINLAHSSLEETIENVNKENRIYNENLGRRLDSFGKQICSLFNYTKGQLENTNVKLDLLMTYVENICTKEFFEELSNSLGADLKKTVAAGYEQVTALTTTSIAQIMECIDDLKAISMSSNDFNDGQKKVVEKIENSIRSQNKQLSGKIMSMSEMFENHSIESRQSFSQIINTQEEIKMILLSKKSRKISQQDAEWRYRSKIPSKYLADKGWGEPFVCPYCKVIDKRTLNDEQYCRCEVCKQIYLAVSPDMQAPDKRFGISCLDVVLNEFGMDPSDPLIPTKRNIQAWREEHSYTSNMYNFPDEVVIVSDMEDVGWFAPRYCYEASRTSNVRTIIFEPNITSIPSLKAFRNLQSVYFMPYDKRTSFQENTIEVYGIYGKTDVRVFGYNNRGVKITPRPSNLI